ncbi:MAG: hypothetical protein IJN29_04570 [Akkermansia sp.]|nr:hypothetical protein [Akkermansia sp.]
MMRAIQLLFLCLCALFLPSCVMWVGVSTHSYPDSVQRQVWVPDKKAESYDLYSLDGKYYIRLPYYSVPAQPSLFSYEYADIYDSEGIASVPSPSYPDYKPGMERREIFQQVCLLQMVNLRQPGRVITPSPEEARAYPHPRGTELLSSDAFAGLKPVGKIRKISSLPVVGETASRGWGNYALMPLTGSLFVADAVLSAVATVGCYVFYNIPHVLYLCI